MDSWWVEPRVPWLDPFILFALDVGPGRRKEKAGSLVWVEGGGPTENWTWKSNKTLPGRKRTSSQSLRRYSAWACHLVLGLLFMLWDCIGLRTCVKEFCSSAVWVFLQPVLSHIGGLLGNCSAFSYKMCRTALKSWRKRSDCIRPSDNFAIAMRGSGWIVITGDLIAELTSNCAFLRPGM